MKGLKTILPEPCLSNKKPRKIMSARINSSSEISPFVQIFFILALTLFAFLPSLSNNFFQLDDPVYIKAVTSWTADNVINLFLHVREGYHPLTLLTLSANYYYGGLNPFSFHLVNLLLHLANTALVFLLIKKLTFSDILACITALIFGLHPVHVEAVAWVASRKDLQYAFFYLLALLSYESFLRNHQWRYYAGALILGIVAIFSKGMAVSLVFSLVLIDYVAGRSFIEKRLWLEKLPFFALSLAFGVINVLAQQARGYIPSSGSMSPLTERLLTASYALGMYLFNFFIPIRLCAYHPYPVMGLQEIILGVVTVVVVTAVIILALRHSRLALFSLLFFLANIALVLQVVPVSTFIIADRYNYISSIGLCLLVALGVRYTGFKSRSAAVVSAILLVTVLTLMGWSTFKRCQTWKNSLTIWTDVLSVYPRAVLALQERAFEHYVYGKYDAADRDLTLALEQAPYRPELHLLRGVTRSRMNNISAALSDLNMAIGLDPRNIKAYISRGLILFNQQDLNQAMEDFTKAIEFSKGQSALSFSHRSMVKNALNDPEGALQDSTIAIEIDPLMINAYINRAIALEQLSQKKAAFKDWRRVVALDPTCPQAIQAVARLMIEFVE